MRRSEGMYLAMEYTDTHAFMFNSVSQLPTGTSRMDRNTRRLDLTVVYQTEHSSMDRKDQTVIEAEIQQQRKTRVTA